MNWKDLFIEPTGSSGKPSDKISDKPKVTGTQFPQSTTNVQQNNMQFPQSKYEPTFPQNNGSVFSPNPGTKTTTPTPTYSEKNPYLDKILDVYDKGFTGLNQPGYDFFEFFKAVCTAGVDNPQVYQMALEMGKAMDSNVTKQSLLNQADYYISELDKVHTTFRTDGQNKLSELTQKKNSETTSLSSTVASLKLQLSTIQDQILSKENELAEIDTKYQPQINEVSLKLVANDSAKNTFIGNINKVKMNISNILK